MLQDIDTNCMMLADGNDINKEQPLSPIHNSELEVLTLISGNSNMHAQSTEFVPVFVVMPSMEIFIPLVVASVDASIVTKDAEMQEPPVVVMTQFESDSNKNDIAMKMAVMEPSLLEKGNLTDSFVEVENTCSKPVVAFDVLVTKSTLEIEIVVTEIEVLKRPRSLPS